jgi:PAS domain S-box-containing protein
MARSTPRPAGRRLKGNALDWENVILGFKLTTRDFLASVVDNLGESIIVNDLEGKIVYYNKGSEKLFGYRAEEMIGKSIVALGVKKPNVLAEIRKGNTFRGELLHTRKNGERFPSYVICIPLKNKQGKPIAMVGSARDLTEEKEINRLKEFNEKVVTSLNDGIQIINKSGFITFVNRRFEQMIGCEADEIAGRHYQSFVAKEVLDKFVKEIGPQGYARGKKVVETTYVTKDNKKIPVLVSSSYLENDGSYEGMINAVTDIAEMKLLKEELFQSEKMGLLGKLAGEIAHEINNPLSGLIIATQMLIEDIEQRRMGRRHLLGELQGIQKDAKRCKNFIEKVLGFSRMIREEKDVFNVSDMIEDALLLVQRQAELDNVWITRDFDDADLYVWGNSNNLQQVVINVVNNAREACLPTGGTIAIKTRRVVEKRKAFAVIEITDTGKPIPEAILGRIFDSFFTTKQKGTGLGLSVSKRIIEEHGGNIVARNLQSGLVSFVISLPLSENGAGRVMRERGIG